MRCHTFVSEASPTCAKFAASVVDMTSKTVTNRTATPWGPATTVDEVRVAQRAGDRRFAFLLQLLENERGDRLVRFAYSTDGTARRGPVTLRLRDLERLRAATVDRHPEL